MELPKHMEREERVSPTLVGLLCYLLADLVISWFISSSRHWNILLKYRDQYMVSIQHWHPMILGFCFGFNYSNQRGRIHHMQIPSWNSLKNGYPKIYVSVRPYCCLQTLVRKKKHSGVR